MMCIIYESYEIGCVDIVCIYMYIYILYNGGRDPYCTGGVQRRSYINIYLEEGTGTAPEEGGRRGIYHISGGRDPYCRAECEDGATIYIYLQLYK